METLTNVIKQIDAWVWGIPLILLILLCGIWLTIRVRGLQVRRIGLALKFMVKNEEEGEGEVTSFGALCTALSATIGTGNIVGVATAIAAGGPGALFWMEIAALFGMATKYAEGFLAIKYRTVDKEGHYLGGPFYYIENGMGSRWKWLAKLFALFGVLAGLLGIGTITQINGITSAANNFFDAKSEHIAFTLFDTDYTWTTVSWADYHDLCCAGCYRRSEAYLSDLPGSCTVYGSGICALLSDYDDLQCDCHSPRCCGNCKERIRYGCGCRRRTGCYDRGNAEGCCKRYLLQ